MAFSPTPKLVCFFLFLWIAATSRAQPGQFLGGELSYRFISQSGNDYVYELNFRMYRDCFSMAELDDPLIRYINTTDITRNTHTLFYREITLSNPAITNLPYNNTGYCSINDPTACFELRMYTTHLTLPYSPEGYTFYYTFCCRNARTNLRTDDGNFGTEIISNIPVPGQALTYIARIPSHDSVAVNSSPFINADSVIYACKGKDIRYQFNFTDPDGDSLSYKFSPSLAKVPAATTNFYPILFNPGYTNANPLAGQPPLALDSISGMLYGVPDRAGSFAIGINIEEFREGKLINISRRDFQVNVVECEIRKPEDVINCADKIVFFNNPNNPANSFLWDFGVPLISTDVSTEHVPYYTYPQHGIYDVKLIVTNPAGCKDSVTSSVRIYPPLQVDFDITGGQCAGNRLTFTDRTVVPSGNINRWTWRVLNTNHVVSASPSFSFVPAVSGTMPYPLAMRLSVQSDLGCRDSLLKDILIYENVKADAGPDRILAFDQPYQMLAGSNLPGYTYSWSPTFGLSDPSIANPVMTANRDISYRLTVSNAAGCTSTDNVSFRYMKGPDIYIATAFTPNNDGLNDVLHFYAAGMASAKLSIYNRWGEVVFSSSDFSNGWDGKWKGILQDTGVYVWHVQARGFDGKPISRKGTVLLIR